MGNGSNNFDYSNHAFNISGVFQSLKFNSFRNAPEVNFEITLEFLEDLQRIKKIRTKKEFILKLKLLSGAILSFALLMYYLIS